MPKRLTVDWLLIALVGLAAAYFLLFYLTEPSRSGWPGYIDQGYYLRLADELSRFTLTKDSFLFGIGYPLAGAPPTWLGLDRDPLVPVNLFGFAFATYATYQAGRRLLSRTAGAVAAGLLAFASPLIIYTVVPWNSTVCLIAMSGLLLIASREPGRRGYLTAGLAGGLLAWAFAARYVDVLWLLPIALVALYDRSIRASLRRWLVMGLVAGVLVAPILALHDRFWGGPFNTPYSRPGLEEQTGGAYQLERIPRAAVGLFVGSDQAGAPDHHRGLLTNMFWLILVLPGIYLVLREPGRRRLIFGTAIAASALGTLFYLSYRASEPNMLKFGTTHYFKQFLPVAALMAGTTVAWLASRPVRGGGSTSPGDRSPGRRPAGKRRRSSSRRS